MFNSCPANHRLWDLVSNAFKFHIYHKVFSFPYHLCLKPVSEGFGLQNLSTVRWKTRIRFHCLQAGNTELLIHSRLPMRYHKTWWDHGSSKSNISAIWASRAQRRWKMRLSYHTATSDSIDYTEILRSLFSTGKTAIVLVPQEVCVWIRDPFLPKRQKQCFLSHHNYF